MGLFDIPAPLYTAIDSLLDFLPPYLRLLLWATVTAIASMALYWLCSAQEKVAAAKQRALTARKRMASYTGSEFSEVLPLAKESLAASGRHFIVVLGPAVLSSLPALTLIVWVSNHFSYTPPLPGTPVRVSSSPVVALTTPVTQPAAAETTGALTVRWPATGEQLPIETGAGATLTTLPLAANVPVIHQHVWWNYLIGNPNGYLPADSATQELRIDLPAIEYLTVGPLWMRGWEFSYFTLLILASLVIKWAFRIQ